MNNFEAWIGKKEVYHDVCNDKPIGMMQALLNQYGQPIDELPLSLKEKVVLKKLIKAVEGTDHLLSE